MQLTFKQAKEFFLDRMKVLEAVEKGRVDSLRRVGGFVRKAARRLMRKSRRLRESELSPAQLALWEAGGRKREDLPFKSSEPGEAPRVRKGTLKKGILFAYDPATQSVVAGPVKFDIQGDAPATLEYGGSAEVTIFEPSLPARKGRPAKGKQLEAFRRKLADGSLKRRVSSGQRRKRVRIARRPFMSPALEKARPVIAQEFKDLIKS
jgi:hypothetical protein